jgi:hypothetical protein
VSSPLHGQIGDGQVVGGGLQTTGGIQVRESPRGSQVACARACDSSATLGAPFSEGEVWKTICSLPSDKAPRQDGFTGNFYKAC